MGQVEANFVFFFKATEMFPKYEKNYIRVGCHDVFDLFTL